MAEQHRSKQMVDEPDPPKAIRRKRSHDTVLTEPQEGRSIQPNEEPNEEPTEQAAEPAKTPSRRKKRVRFSDPGPEINASSSSTGLTPSLRRTTFIQQDVTPASRRGRVNLPKRLSMPNLRTNSSIFASLSTSPVPLSGSIQFEAFSDIINRRDMRRLRRSHLSEAQNEILAQRKSAPKLKEEIHDLRAKLETSEESGDKGHEAERNNERLSLRIRELEQELLELKNEMQKQPTAPEYLENIPVASDPPNTASAIYIEDDSTGIYEDMIYEDPEALRASTPVAAPTTYDEASTQASLPHPQDTETLRSARLSLEYLFPGEIALGLIPDYPKPLLDIMLERLQILKTQTLVAEDALSTTQTQESNLRNQFNAVLQQLDRARKYAEKVGAKHNDQKARASASESRVQLLETSVQDASTKVQDLETSSEQKDLSIKRLQDALESYRLEVGKLEDLITRLEAEHNAALSSLRSEMDEAVADLECHVVAETIGRREAEAAVDARDARIHELSARERELTAAVHEKQNIVRETEAAFGEERTGRQREVGILNVQLSALATDLHAARASLTTAELARDTAVQNLRDEREAAVRALAAAEDEMTFKSRNINGIQDAFISDGRRRRRGTEAAEVAGLLTPICERFRDVAGEGVSGGVVVRRGKRARDSGVEILEEMVDEEEVGGWGGGKDLVMSDL